MVVVAACHTVASWEHRTRTAPATVVDSLCTILEAFAASQQAQGLGAGTLPEVTAVVTRHAEMTRFVALLARRCTDNIPLSFAVMQLATLQRTGLRHHLPTPANRACLEQETGFWGHPSGHPKEWGSPRTKNFAHEEMASDTDHQSGYR
jgi:hypothetical protein